MDEQSVFQQVQRDFEQIWSGADAQVVDFGGRSLMDHLYPAVIESEEFRQLLVRPGGFTIVDLGAGRGSRLVLHLARAGPRIIAVDCFPSFGRLPLGYPGDKVMADILQNGLRAGIADLVVSAWVTVRNPLFANPTDRRRYVGEILRLLKPGGLFWGEEPALTAQDFAGPAEVTDYYHLQDFHVHCFRKP